MKFKNSIKCNPQVTGLPIIGPKEIASQLGFDNIQLRPDGVRQPLVEASLMADLVMAINGMSGQLND